MGDGKKVWEDSYDGWADEGRDRDAKDQLASAAPDMARVLLAVEWSGSTPTATGPHPTCPSCAGMQPHPSRDAGPRGGHRKDCALDAALRKAGAR